MTIDRIFASPQAVLNYIATRNAETNSSTPESLTDCLNSLLADADNNQVLILSYGVKLFSDCVKQMTGITKPTLPIPDELLNQVLNKEFLNLLQKKIIEYALIEEADLLDQAIVTIEQNLWIFKRYKKLKLTEGNRLKEIVIAKIFNDPSLLATFLALPVKRIKQALISAYEADNTFYANIKIIIARTFFQRNTTSSDDTAFYVVNDCIPAKKLLLAVKDIQKIAYGEQPDKIITQLAGNTWGKLYHLAYKELKKYQKSFFLAPSRRQRCNDLITKLETLNAKEFSLTKMQELLTLLNTASLAAMEKDTESNKNRWFGYRNESGSRFQRCLTRISAATMTAAATLASYHQDDDKVKQKDIFDFPAQIRCLTEQLTLFKKEYLTTEVLDKLMLYFEDHRLSKSINNLQSSSDPLSDLSTISTELKTLKEQLTDGTIIDSASSLQRSMYYTSLEMLERIKAIQAAAAAQNPLILIPVDTSTNTTPPVSPSIQTTTSITSTTSTAVSSLAPESHDITPPPSINSRKI